MISLGRLTAFLAPALVGAGLLINPAPALADSSDPDGTFLAEMHALGFTWPAGDDAPVIALGRQICADRKDGRTPDSIGHDIHSALGPKSITYSEATSVVTAAVSNYCPTQSPE